MDDNRFVQRDLYEAMEKRVFKLVVSESYNPSIDQYYLDNNIEPINSNEMGTSITYVPVISIIDIVYDGIEFSFKNPNDIVDVVNMLKRYLDLKATAFGTVGIDNSNLKLDAKLFVEKCEYTYKKLYKYVPMAQRPKEFVRSIVDIMESR